MLRNPQWNKIIYSGCRTTQLLWTDGICWQQRKQGEGRWSIYVGMKTFSQCWICSFDPSKTPILFQCHPKHINLQWMHCHYTSFFFLKWTWPIQKKKIKNGRIKWRSWCHPFNPNPSLFFHTHSHMQTFMTLSYFSSLELYFKKTQTT